MSKLLIVFGATGQQGGSVIDHVVNDPELSKQYKIRAVTRDTSKPAAKDLQAKGVEVAQGDAEDEESLKRVLQGAHTVFAMTVSGFGPEAKQTEIAQGKRMVHHAIDAGAQLFIWSAVANVTKTSGGKYTQVDFFDSAAEVAEYIKTLPIKSIMYLPGSFMQNFTTQMAPRPMGDGTYAIANMVSPQSQWPLIEIAADTGKFVGAMLAEPEKYVGKDFSAATRVYTLQEIADTMSKVSGKTVKYSQLPQEVYASFLPPEAAPKYVEMVLFVQDFGYYGAKTQQEVEWTGKQARGKLTTLEEYLAKNLKLE